MAGQKARATLLLSLVVPCSSSVQAQDQQSALVVLSIAAERTGEAWMAEAFEKNMGKELANFERIRLADMADIDTSGCSSGNHGCLVSEYAQAGADVVFLGVLVESSVEYRVYETWRGNQVGSGSVYVGRDATLPGMRRQIVAALNPILRSGGLLDEKPLLLQAQDHPTVSATGSTRAAPDLWVTVALVVAMVIFCLPTVLLSALVGFTAARENRNQTHRPWLFLFLTALAAALVLHLAGPVGLVERLQPFVEQVAENVEHLLYIIGGLAWGWLAWLNATMLWPRLHGIERVRHHNVRPLLAVWVHVVLQRSIVLLLVNSPIALALWAACTILEIEPTTALVLYVPIAGLCLWFWWWLLAENAAVYLDHKLVNGPKGPTNPWHVAAKKYFLGYVRRLGVAVDKHLLERVLILPGDQEGVASYGGGPSRARIVIDSALLELALGPIEEEAEGPSVRQVGSDEWSSGLLVPTPESKGWHIWRRLWGRRAARRKLAKGRRRRALIRPVRRRELPRLIGENATLLGYVIPLGGDEAVPLIANDQEDYGVVRHLLTEHYAAFETGIYGDEYDDTDPTQKDFLFGAILREMGGIQRRSGLLASVTLAWRLCLERAPGFVQRSFAFLERLITRGSSCYSDVLSDAETALNSGRDHLVQYLYLCMTGNESLLTTRADMPELCRTSNRILQKVAGQTPSDPDSQDDEGTTVRLAWLSRYFYEVAPVLQIPRRRVWVLATCLVIALGMYVTSAVTGSIEYNIRYVERMEQLQQSLAGTQEEGQRDGAHQEQ